MVLVESNVKRIWITLGSKENPNFTTVEKFKFNIPVGKMVIVMIDIYVESRK